MTDTPTIAFPFTDYGGDGPVVLALHGHFGSARAFAGLARQLGDAIRLIALDQRGHGQARKRQTYAPEDYVADAAAFVEEQGLAPAVVLGHSMGGVIAYTLAATRPELVRAVIVEDAPAFVPEATLDVRSWPTRAPSLRELGEAIEAQGLPDASYFLESAVRYADGWGLAFDAEEMMRSQAQLVGDRWDAWLAVEQPLLLLHGTESIVLDTDHAHEMVERRPQTRYREFAGRGHWIHDDDAAGVAEAIASFVGELEDGAVDARATTAEARP